MSDRELLEKAAKAAGIEVFFNDMGFCQVRSNTLSAGPTFWNPLHDDGDALRLAVTLHLIVCSHQHESWAQHLEITAKEPHGTDDHSATRRAIVRAAAAIADHEAAK